MRYKLTLRCNNFRHGAHKYTKTVDINEDDGERLEDVPNPPCPLCKKIIKKRDEDVLPTAAIPPLPMEQWLETQRGPALGGRNNLTKATDMAADIAMKDYGLTDLKDNVREGETMAPSLPPVQQKLADNFFNPGGNAAFGPNGRKRQAMVHRLGQKAIAGAFRSQALDVKSVLPDKRIALRQSRVEPIK